MTDIQTFDKAYEDAFEFTKNIKNGMHILLGNGFSIATHPKFQYGSLYEQAKASVLSERITALFDRYGTTNFEEILRLLDEGQWLVKIYDEHSEGTQEAMRADYNAIKIALVNTIGQVHPDSRASISDEKLSSAVRFLEQFDQIFSTSYDLILYWAMLRSAEEEKNKGQYSLPGKFQDGFSSSLEEDGKELVFTAREISSKKFVYFLHGALHLTTKDGRVLKTVWKSDNVAPMTIIDQVREGIESKRYPLIVSEGKHTDKLRVIGSSGYLSSAFRKFEEIQGCLFTYGTALSTEDQHLQDVIVRNKKINLLSVGLYGNEDLPENKELIQKTQNLRQRRELLVSRSANYTGSGQLYVQFYDSSTAKVWPSKT